ncbi:MAG: cell division protein ZapE [Pseudomonadota bacterium]
MTPLQRYRQDLQRPDFAADAAQEAAVARLQAVYDRLLAAGAERPNLFARLLRNRRAAPVPGLYFWGGVGRGKTYLMDSFYESLPLQRKLRMHFHRFMRRVHRDLERLKGERNPLRLVAAGIADEARVLCFDEFFVSDIADAMILAGLLETLFERGVTLIATSNIEPDRLYENGLQRQRFLPAIELVKRHCEVVNVDGGIDYRLRSLSAAPLYYHPLGADAERRLNAVFHSLVPAAEEIRKGVALEIEGREIPALYVAEDVAWFEFAALCDGPRSQNDYIELAREFHAVLVSGVPALDAGRDDQARRLINLVDEFYDRNVKLALAAAVPLPELYTGTRLAFEFERTRSRLREMQSREYLARAHRP